MSGLMGTIFAAGVLLIPVGCSEEAANKGASRREPAADTAAQTSTNTTTSADDRKKPSPARDQDDDDDDQKGDDDDDEGANGGTEPLGTATNGNPGNDQPPPQGDGAGYKPPPKMPPLPQMTFNDAAVQTSFDTTRALLEALQAKHKTICAEGSDFEACAKTHGSELKALDDATKRLADACLPPPPEGQGGGGQQQPPPQGGPEAEEMQKNMTAKLSSAACASEQASAAKLK